MKDKRHPLPPFDEVRACAKVKLAERAWNTRDAEKVSRACTEESVWRNRDEFLEGREEILAFLTRKWQKELGYRLQKELWSYTGNRIAVRFQYEWHDTEEQWFRAYGNELWQFNTDGFMEIREATINDMAIEKSDRQIFAAG